MKKLKNKIKSKIKGKIENSKIIFRTQHKPKLLFQVYLPLRSKFDQCLNPKRNIMYAKLLDYLKLQKKEWQKAYTGNYFYQGYEKIGIHGVKPTEKRISNYEIREFFTKDKEVLDIGSNAGFVALHIADWAKSVDGIELNPYLNMIANEVKSYLDKDNTIFYTEDFTKFETSKKYDIIFSLSNHHTIDGNLDMGFHKYVDKIYSLLNENGILLFESHNVWGPGEGGAGDDGDLDMKFDYVEKYFDIIKFKMVNCFYKDVDVDKLFVVLKKKAFNEASVRTLELEKARLSYSYKD